MSTVDLTKGIYRKVFSGFLRGKRINKVSFEAEALFWRLNMLADDYGNLEADDLAMDAFPRRRVEDDDVEAWVEQLVEVGLVRRYAVGGDAHLHIEGFEELQPAGRNGKRIKRVLGVSEGDQIDPPAPGESGGIQIDPGCGGESGLNLRPETEYENDTEEENENESEYESGDGVGNGAELDRLDAASASSREGKAAGGSGSGVDFSLTDSGSDSGGVARLKARARWHAAAVPMVGMSHGSRHSPQSKQYASDLTCVERIFEGVWPEERVDKPPGFERLLELAGEAMRRKTPLAWLQSMLKKERLLVAA